MAEASEWLVCSGWCLVSSSLNILILIYPIIFHTSILLRLPVKRWGVVVQLYILTKQYNPVNSCEGGENN